MTCKLFSFLILCLSAGISAQTNFSGKYTGLLEGEAVVLDLSTAGGNAYTGLLNDSHNDFVVEATVTGNKINGTATVKLLGVAFDLKGDLVGSGLKLSLVFEYGGERSETKLALQKSGSKTQVASKPASPSQVKLPAGAELNPALTGVWTKSETYNSGYGDNFMGANFSQSMVFYPDGRLGEGGSSASISGGNYSGGSSGAVENVMDGLLWYNKGNQLYLQYTENGQTQQIHLGKYYIEGKNLLITGVNGEKLLLSK